MSLSLHIPVLGSRRKKELTSPRRIAHRAQHHRGTQDPESEGARYQEPQRIQCTGSVCCAQANNAGGHFTRTWGVGHPEQVTWSLTSPRDYKGCLGGWGSNTTKDSRDTRPSATRGSCFHTDSINQLEKDLSGQSGTFDYELAIRQ